MSKVEAILSQLKEVAANPKKQWMILKLKQVKAL